MLLSKKIPLSSMFLMGALLSNCTKSQVAPENPLENTAQQNPQENAFSQDENLSDQENQLALNQETEGQFDAFHSNSSNSNNLNLQENSQDFSNNQEQILENQDLSQNKLENPLIEPGQETNSATKTPSVPENSTPKESPPQQLHDVAPMTEPVPPPQAAAPKKRARVFYVRAESAAVKESPHLEAKTIQTLRRGDTVLAETGPHGWMQSGAHAFIAESQLSLDPLTAKRAENPWTSP